MIYSQRGDAGPKFRAVIEQPSANRFRKQRRDREVPEEHPNEQRHVSKKLYVKRGHPTKRRDRYRAQRAGNGAEGDRENPGKDGKLNGGEKPVKEPDPGLTAPEDTPIEAVGHR